MQPKASEFKRATITGHFGLVFEENSVREITWSSRHLLRKPAFLKRFLSTGKRKAPARFEERFRKAPFRDRFRTWTVGLAVEIKLRFQISLAWCARCISVLPNLLLFIISYCVEPVSWTAWRPSSVQYPVEWQSKLNVKQCQSSLR